jgi:nitrite reductase (NO-forming)
MPAVTRGRLDRNADRRITAGGIAIAGGFVAAALATLALPEGARLGAWLPLHLVLVGGAGVAMGSAMPFFSAALSAAPPAPVRLRLVTLALLAAGAIGVASRAAVGGGALPVLGGSAYLAGIVGLFGATFLPLRGALGPRRPLVSLAYGAALADALAGVVLGTSFIGGWLPVVGSWGSLKPAHAWLNLLGFVSLVITGTLIHLLPTVLGGRMLPRTSSVVAVTGLVVGTPLVALGFAISGGPGPAADLIARSGALVALAGAAGLAGFARAAVRGRGHWTTDAGWHRLTSWSLVAAVGWFALATGLAAGRVLIAGAMPAGWSAVEVAAPLALGWVVQALVAGWSHLLPSIGPGDPPAHARQRQLLGRVATARLLGLNLGTALLAVGLPADLASVSVVGALFVGASAGISVALAAAALLGARQVAAPARR